MKQEITKDIVFAFFAGRATSLQRKWMEEWVADPRNSEQFYEWVEEWETAYPQFSPDTTQAVQRYVARMKAGHQHPARSLQGGYATRPDAWQSVKPWARAAAVVVLLTAAAWLSKESILYERYQTGYGQIKTVTLADGSSVTLNAHSVLRVPRFRLGSQARSVLLSGEAAFSVVHTRDNRTFLVNTPDKLEVEVLGTEFIVYSRPRGTKVVLNKGRVQLRYLPDARRKPLTIKPGDVVLMDAAGTFEVKPRQPLYVHNAWKNRRFVFDNTPLSEIARTVQEHFGIRVEIAEAELAARTISGTYRAEHADELLRVISEMMNLRFEKDTGRVRLSQ